MTDVDYTALRKLLVHSIKLGSPKGTKVKTKLVTNKKTGEKEIKAWTRLPIVQYVDVEFKIEKDKP